jgi:hypothetical protein
MASMAGSAGMAVREGMAVRAGMAAEAAATARNRPRLARSGEIGAVRIRWLEIGPDVVGADPVCMPATLLPTDCQRPDA